MSIRLTGSGPEPPKVSIIIPTLNEAAIIEDTLRRLVTMEEDFEVIVADNGSTDDTVQLASQRAKVVASPRGRGAAMNAGAEAARGDILLFLHADTRLPKGALTAVRQAMANPSATGGCFSVRFDGRGWEPWMVTWLYGLFARAGFFYGDAAIFVRRDLFRSIGGFKPLPLMEDFDFCLRLRRLGGTVRLRKKVESSGRRWRGQGFFSTLLVFLAIQGLYLAGVRHPRLFELYKPVR